MQEMVLTSPKSAHKSMKEQFESVSSYIVDYLWDQPAIYCGTYKKYNEGSLFGAWLDLRTFDSYEEFIDVCKQLHADEEDPELMFQDYQCFPAEWYSESCMDEEVFDKIIAFIQMDDDKQKAFKAYVGSPDKPGGEIPQTKRKVIHLHHEPTRTFSIGAVDSAIRDTFKL